MDVIGTILAFIGVLVVLVLVLLVMFVVVLVVMPVLMGSPARRRSRWSGRACC